MKSLSDHKKVTVMRSSLHRFANHSQPLQTIGIVEFYVTEKESLHRARKNGLQNVISTTQAGLGRLV